MVRYRFRQNNRTDFIQKQKQFGLVQYITVITSENSRESQFRMRNAARREPPKLNSFFSLSHLSTILFTMSLLTREGRITLKAFASVPPLADLPEIQQAPGSVSNLSSIQSADDRIDLAEGCILTKSVKYTHQLVHWVNAVHSGDPGDVVSRKLIGDSIIRHDC